MFVLLHQDFLAAALKCLGSRQQIATASLQTCNQVSGLPLKLFSIFQGLYSTFHLGCVMVVVCFVCIAP